MTYGTASNAKASDTKISNAMADNMADESNNRSSFQSGLSCMTEGLSPIARDRSRSDTLARLNLLDNDTVPVFEEATQNVSRLLAMPICILSVMDTDVQRFKSVVGLSSLGLMNQLAAARSLPRQESFCTHVIDSGKTFVLADAVSHPAFSRSLLVQQYGIQSYLGVPLMTTEGCCIGTLAVMDLLPHEFTPQEIAFLELSARWSMSEFEKQNALVQVAQVQQNNALSNRTATNGDGSESSLLARVNQVRFDLIVQLTQDLRNPLTSVTGMASMLSREIYGPLSEKQQEYAKIVLSSSQQLLGMVNEIVEIGDLQEDSYQLAIAPVDIEMLSQQALSSLASIAKQQDLKLKLTVEPGSRVWNLDKRIVKQLIYHLVFSIIKMSTAGSTIRLHVSRKGDSVNLALWVSNPWLGEDLPQAVIAWDRDHSPAARSVSMPPSNAGFSHAEAERFLEGTLQDTTEKAVTGEAFEAISTAQKVNASRQELGLLLSRHLTKIHGGEAHVQGSAASGYRYIVTLPSLGIAQ